MNVKLRLLGGGNDSQKLYQKLKLNTARDHDSAQEVYNPEVPVPMDN